MWATPTASLEADAVAAAKQADAVVMFLGLTARLEGEEMSVAIDGFRGGDRTSIDLPAAQQRLLERIVVGREADGARAAQRQCARGKLGAGERPGDRRGMVSRPGGNAIADVLFGDYNPAGRLPVTFYRSVDDVPAFDDYRMAGRTYRFFKGQPLYPFGYGLSYTTFTYANLRTSAESAGASDTVMVSVDVTNSGKRSGDEVVQMYVEHVGSSVERPIRELRGYRRLTLAPGETRDGADAASDIAHWRTGTRRRIGGSSRRTR